MRARLNVSDSYQQATALKLQLQSDITALESRSRNGSGPIPDVAEVERRLQEFERCLGTLAQLAETNARKVLWQSRHHALANHLWSFTASLQHFQRARAASQFARDHEALMGSAPDAALIRSFEDEADALRRSEGHLESYLEQGAGLLGDLRQQSQKLTGVSGKLHDLLGSLGVSRSLLRLAERQTSIDQYTVFGGMAVVLLVFYVTYFFDTSVARFNLI
jgi:hypothetical protein